MSDIDIFVYGLNETQATARLQQVIADVSKQRRKIDSDVHNVVVHSKHATTLVGCKRFPPVQFILRVYRSATEVLLGFDVDCCCVGMGSDMKPRANARGWRALVTGLNAIDLTRRSPSYERRLLKYSVRGYGIYVGYGFDKEHVDCKLWDFNGNRRNLSGFLPLLLADDNYPYTADCYTIKSSIASSVDVKPISDTKSKFSDEGISDYDESIYSMPNYTSLSSNEAKNLFEHEQERNRGKPTGIVRKYGTSGDVVTFLQFDDDSDCDYMNISKFVELKWLVTNPGSQGRLVTTDEGLLMTGSFAPISDSVQSWFQDSLWNKNYHYVAPTYTTLNSLLLGKRRNNGVKPEKMLELVESNKLAHICNEVDATFFNKGKSILQTIFNPRYFLGIEKVSRQIHPHLVISNKAMLMIAGLNAQTSSMCMNISIDITLSHRKPLRKTLSARAVQSSVRFAFPGKLANHAVSEGTKAFFKISEDHRRPY